MIFAQSCKILASLHYLLFPRIDLDRNISPVYLNIYVVSTSSVQHKYTKSTYQVHINTKKVRIKSIMPKKEDDEKRTIQIKFLVTEEEHEKINNYARRYFQTKSDFIRSAIL